MPWHVQATEGFTRTTPEAIDNATQIYNILASRGWTVNAVCGVLGNMQAESGLNPWRWQNDEILASTDTHELTNHTRHAYGLPQFDTASKYIDNAKNIAGYGPNFSDKAGSLYDGYAQTVYIDEHADYYSSNAYPIEYNDYKKLTYSGGYCAVVWLYNYERPEVPSASQAAREEAGNYWFSVLGGTAPVDPDPPTGGGGTSTRGKIWFYLRNINNN